MTPKKPRNLDAAGKEDPAEVQSEAFKAFEDLAKQVLRVPKSELDKRESDYKANHKQTSPPKTA